MDISHAEIGRCNSYRYKAGVLRKQSKCNDKNIKRLRHRDENYRNGERIGILLWQSYQYRER